VRSGQLWNQQAKLRSGQPQLQERFGQSLSISGDEVVVGAYCLVASGCIGPGAAYTFARTAGVWSAPQRVSPPSLDGENFGHALAHAGGQRVVAGAFGADLGGPIDQGAAYLLIGPDFIFQSGME
jgi:hypothetical protein